MFVIVFRPQKNQSCCHGTAAGAVIELHARPAWPIRVLRLYNSREGHTIATLMQPVADWTAHIAAGRGRNDSDI